MCIPEINVINQLHANLKKLVEFGVLKYFISNLIININICQIFS